MAAYEAFKVERTEHVAEVILTGPGKGNAMGPAFFRELPEVQVRVYEPADTA